MSKGRLDIHRWVLVVSVIFLTAGFFFYSSPMARAEGEPDAALYSHLSQVAGGNGDVALFEKLNTGARKLDWARAEEKEFAGHLRVIKAKSGNNNLDQQAIYLLRELTGKIYILSLPEDTQALRRGIGFAVCRTRREVRK